MGFMSSSSTLCLTQINALAENNFRADQKLFKGALPLCRFVLFLVTIVPVTRAVWNY